MTADILRAKFLVFFKARKHKAVESDSLVPKDDPTVLFTPAGMNQFKKEFLGYDSGFKRAASSQRCLRTDDLDKVGKTTGHHTFFEMLGNFSFGDYFKKDAIIWAWEFLTKELGIPQEKLWVSVYKDDEEAYKIWEDIVKVSKEKIVKLGDKENFWPSEAKEKGPNGPCGPCSEIFYDLGQNIGCGEKLCDPSCSCGRFIEVWNLVFTQFNRKEGGVLEPLPNKNIDTGMGLERLASVMQGAANNFETDLFQPIIKEIEQGLSPTPIVGQAKGTVPKGLIYAISDHIRAIVFSIYDGVLPSNEGRGYIVRKLIRKSTLHLRALGAKHEFLYKLVPVVAEVMKTPYPDLALRQENIAEIVLSEEKNFNATLNSSDKLERMENKPVLDMAKKDPQGPDGFIIASAMTSSSAAKVAFRLYDTYGIPLELTKNWWDTKHKIIFDENLYFSTIDKSMDEQKIRSKSQSAMKGDVFSVKDIDHGLKETRFLGYKVYSNKAKIVKILKDGAEVKKISPGEEAAIILDATCFYGESGGQVGDSGEIVKGKNIFEVTDTKRSNKIILHIGKVKEGSFKKNDPVTAKINLKRRLAIARNHTATHLLQAALRKVLGMHVQQQGSLVAENKLRFDFTHFKDVSKEELDRIEEVVNSWVIENFPVGVVQKSLVEAKKSGALAFFGEKYDAKVRIVSTGDLSKEFCGGTHLNFTGQIGLFKILSEGSVASGVRRIEAATGNYAYKAVKEEEGALAEISARLGGAAVDKLTQELDKRNSLIKELEKEINARKVDSLKESVDSLINAAELINGKKFIARIFESVDMDLLRKNADLIKQKTDNAIMSFGSRSKDRAMLVIGVTLDLCGKGVDAGKLIKEVGPIIGGSGGGRADFAQAGGTKPDNLEAAILKLKEII